MTHVEFLDALKKKHEEIRKLKEEGLKLAGKEGSDSHYFITTRLNNAGANLQRLGEDLRLDDGFKKGL